MARVSAEERREAVTLIPANDIPVDDDIGDAFNAWRAGFQDSETPGTLRAYEIPLDERGNPQATAKNQIRLGAWPIDLYSFDELCTMLMRDFMQPGRTLAVRFLGVKAGAAGIQFNKIIILRTPASKANDGNSAPAPESTASLMKVIQENNERMLSQFRQMLPQKPERDTMEELQRMMLFSKAMNEPMMAMLSSLLPALAGRPVAAAGGDPFTQLSGLVDVFGKLQDLRSEGGGAGGDNDDSVVGIIKSLVPIAKPALEALPSILAQRPVVAMRPAQPRPPAAVTGPRPPPPGSQPTQPAPAAAPPAASANIGDIPSGDAEMFAQLKPQIDALVQMAGQGSDAGGAADILFEQVIMSLPDEFYEKLADVIGGPNFVTQAAVFNPGVNAHRAWFEAFQKQVIARYEAEDAASRDAPTDPGA